MAASGFDEKLYTSSEFVESAGLISFHLSSRRICLIYNFSGQEWLLPKGRRNIGESREDTAIREIKEETGYSCRLLPVTLETRCCPAIEIGETSDEPRLFQNAREPFMVVHRNLPRGKGVKLIWWFVGVIDESSPVESSEAQFSAKLFTFSEALSALRFQNDRDIVAKAIEIFQATYDHEVAS